MWGLSPNQGCWPSQHTEFKSRSILRSCSFLLSLISYLRASETAYISVECLNIRHGSYQSTVFPPAQWLQTKCYIPMTTKFKFPSEPLYRQRCHSLAPSDGERRECASESMCLALRTKSKKTLDKQSMVKMSLLLSTNKKILMICHSGKSGTEVYPWTRQSG